MKKKAVVITVTLILVAAVAVVIFIFLRKNRTGTAGSDTQPVYVYTVISLMGLDNGDLGLSQRFSGIVEPQKTVDIQNDSGRTVSEVYVSEEQAVKAGDPLFSYTTDDLTLQLSQQQLELDRLNNSITTQNQQIADLIKQAQNATGDTLLQYTIQIQQAQNDEKQSEYDAQAKQVEINKTNEQINNSIVTAPIDGTVTHVGNPEQPQTDSSTGQTEAFLTITASGDLRVKGYVNEQNISAIQPGQTVTILSRLDNGLSWTGTVDQVDTKNAESASQNTNYYGAQDNTDLNTTSRYPFYVTLESADGLMNGQHVLIQMDSGDLQLPHTDGVWLYEGYLMMDDQDPSTAYVYKAQKGKIVKQKVTLGEYDQDMGYYQITDGLTQDDAIAWPDETVQEGAPVQGLPADEGSGSQQP